MILGFKEFFDTKKEQRTFFRERIWLGVGQVFRRNAQTKGLDSMPPCTVTIDKKFIEHHNLKPKLHTLREDKFDRWKAGRTIQMVYRGAFYKIKDHFNDGIPQLGVCRSTQKIEIKWVIFHMKPLESMGIKGGTSRVPTVIVDGRAFEGACTQIIQLAQNDGFDSLESFYNYFNKNFTGKIIHWTDLRY